MLWAFFFDNFFSHDCGKTEHGFSILDRARDYQAVTITNGQMSRRAHSVWAVSCPDATQ